MSRKQTMFPVGRLFADKGVFNPLLSRCQQNLELLYAIRSRLPDPLCDHCHSASLNEGRLTLYTSSPTWVGQLRFMQRQLERELVPFGIQFSSLQVKVLAIHQPRKAAARHATPLSQQNATSLQQIAMATHSASLQASLLRLSRHFIPSN